MKISTPYEMIGGEQTLLNLVERFYFYMDTLPEAQGIPFQPPVLVAFYLRTINLRTICESSRFLRIDSNHVMGVYIAAECY